MFEDLGVIGHETFRCPFHPAYSAADSRHEVLDFLRLARDEIHNSVKQSRLKQFVAADADILRTLLP